MMLTFESTQLALQLCCRRQQLDKQNFVVRCIDLLCSCLICFLYIDHTCHAGDNGAAAGNAVDDSAATNDIADDNAAALTPSYALVMA